MSYTQNKSQENSSSGQTQTNIPLNTYEYARQVIDKQIESLKEEMNRTEIEWLNLCNLTQQAKTTEIKAAEPLFKDAAELNAVPLPVKLETFENANQTSQHNDEDEDEEFSDDE